jgi:hypothetical protein
MELDAAGRVLRKPLLLANDMGYFGIRPPVVLVACGLFPFCPSRSWLDYDGYSPDRQLDESFHSSDVKLLFNTGRSYSSSYRFGSHWQAEASDSDAA